MAGFAGIRSVLDDFIVRRNLEQLRRRLVAVEILHLHGGFAAARIGGLAEDLNPEFAGAPNILDSRDFAVVAHAPGGNDSRDAGSLDIEAVNGLRGKLL